MNIPPKIQTLLYGIGSAITGYVAYFLGLPPQLQTGILGDLIALCPPSWQPMAAGTAKTISTIAGLYASHRLATASQHQPTPPPPVTRVNPITGRALPVLLVCAMLAGLAGCVTTEGEDGTRVTRWDADATIKGIGAAADIWERVDRQSRIIGYNQLGQPIYAQ